MEVRKALVKIAQGFFTNKSYFQSSLPYGSQVVSSSGSNVKFRLFSTFLNYLIGGSLGAKRFMESFITSPLVFIVVNKIQQKSASIEKIIKNSKGDQIEKDRSKLWEILRKPNEKQNYIEFMEDAINSILLTGNIFIHRIRASGGIGMELRVARPQTVQIFTNSVGDVERYEYTDEGGDRFTVSDPEDMLHIKTSNLARCEQTNLEWGISPIEAMWIVVQSSNEKFNAEASIFKNRGIIGILTTKGDTMMLPDERERLQQEFDSEVGGSDKYNKIKISSSELGYIQTGMSPTDLKLLEGIVSSLRMICAGYGMPSVLFNDTEQSTYNNILEAKTTAINDVYLPINAKIDDKISEWLDLDETIHSDLTSIEELRNTTNKFLRVLNSLEPRVANRAIEALTVNEAREMFEVDEIEGGDQRIGETTVNNTDTDED